MSDAAGKFDEFFARNNFPGYGGRTDLSRLHRDIAKQLRLLQETLNNALAGQDVNDIPPFHLDYVDARPSNAHAFLHGGHSFIAITMPMVYELSDVSLKLSKSQNIASLLKVRYSSEDFNDLHGIMFGISLGFVVSHEYTHHKYGHCQESEAQNAFRGMNSRSVLSGTSWSQVDELVADGYAIYLIMATFIGKLGTPDFNPFSTISLDSSSISAEEQMYATIITALAGYWLSLPDKQIDSIKAYQLEHPLMAARLSALIEESRGWCSWNKPSLAEFMASNFTAFIEGTAIAIKGTNQIWPEQFSFLNSPEGMQYRSALDKGVAHAKEKLRNSGLPEWPYQFPATKRATN